ncbi:MAG: AmmeMemoRadiSam system radical SAM enzyme, partial [Treponema sp.]|nr:AmmeMemoRadiSam system radical SAM enzyme [Treponema sp.]
MKARFYEAEENGARCTLCPHGCLLRAGTKGRCGVRRGSGGNGAFAISLPRYAVITALASDPVEKKPLYHWRPGSRILSAGFAGCNLVCPFCQNASISQNPAAPGRRMEPDDLAAAAAESGCGQLAFTYSEPLVHAEYLAACMKAARKAGVATVLVSNGCVNAGAAAEVLALCDAANIDLKSFSAQTYRNTLGGSLRAVLDFIETALALGVHLEITTLVVTGLNDSGGELDEIASFIARLGPKPPVWHLSAYHPCWKYDAPATDPARLVAAVRRAREKLPVVYPGNAGAPA